MKYRSILFMIKDQARGVTEYCGAVTYDTSIYDRTMKSLLEGYMERHHKATYTHVYSGHGNTYFAYVKDKCVKIFDVPSHISINE